MQGEHKMNNGIVLGGNSSVRTEALTREEAEKLRPPSTFVPLS